MPELNPGDVLGGCRVEAVIARGGMGVVYRAVQLDLQRPVALKVIAGDRAEDPEFRERFERESRMAAAIDHPNVVPVYAAGEEDGALFIVMRFVPGSDLHALIKEVGGLPPQRAAAIVGQVAAALDAAHAAGLVHRDVKPANVLLASDSGHAYLSDFGLMRALDPQVPLTDSGRWMGTVDFAAPEQLRGERVEARSDVYSLGCVLYAALTGGPPFPRGTVTATMLAHLDDPRPRPSTAGAPPSFDRVIARALAKDPADRYPSAGDLGRAAEAASRGEHVTESERTVAIGPAAPEGGGDVTAPTAVVARPRPRSRALTAEPPPAWTPAPAPARRAHPAPPAPATAPAPARHDVPRRRRLGRRGVLAALALPLAGVATVAALMLDDDNGRDVAAAQTRPLAEGEVRAAAEAFAQAYETEDVGALRRLLSADVERVLPDGVVRGRDAVASEYASQFRVNATQSYELEGLDVRGGRAGRASGDYRVRRSGRPSLSGRIVLVVVRDRGRTRIALITVTPG